LKQFFLSFVIFFFIGLSSSAQKVDVLKLGKKRFFKETNNYYLDFPLTLLCEVCYDDPRSLDEEYCRSISIIIKDTAQFTEYGTYSIKNDTSIIQCTYDRLSLSDVDGKNDKISGTVKLLRRTIEFIELEMNIEVHARSIYIYKGKRRFTRA